MKLMTSIIDKEHHIPVDMWNTKKYPADEADKIFKNVKGDIILPIAEFFGVEEKARTLDYFTVSPKRSYNSDETREHICRYLNYFEKFYDTDKELLLILYQIKLAMDYNKQYTVDMLCNDINRYIIRNKNLYFKIRRFVDDNYLMTLSSNNNKTPNLQFENIHAKVLYEISLMMNMYIPLITHFMYIHFIKDSSQIQFFVLKLFDLAVTKYEEEHGIYIYDKLYETATSVVNKSKNPDKILWEKNKIRGINPTTHTEDAALDIVLQIMPKYTYIDAKDEDNLSTDKVNNIINFNYFSNRQCLRFKITDISYEYPFVKLSSSKRDEDQNSEFDRYEARLNKKDESLFLQNKVSCEQTVKTIELKYGPFDEEEIMYYKKRLTQDNKPVINSFQKQLISYLFFKDFGDQVSIQSINQIDYIKLLIAAKRILLNSGLVILPYIISSKVTRVATRKNINKKETTKITNGENWQQILAKYNNPKISQRVLEMIGKINSSTFEIIEYDLEHHCPSERDGIQVPICSDLINEELSFFILMI